MPEAWAIETSGLTKRYDGVEALHEMSLRIPRGSIAGFVGRNGAGKTTTLKILLGMSQPDAGEARVLGLACADPAASLEIRRRTGFVSEDKELFSSMSVNEVIRFTASFYPRWRKDLEDSYRRRFELPGDRGIKALSRGMRTKLALLLALCRSAELLILDEPTSGLDPAATEEVLQAIVGHVAREEMTVFFSSHQIAEVEQICDHVTIVDRGSVLVAGALDDLRARYCRLQLVFEGEAPKPDFRAPGVVRARRQGRVLTVLSDGNREPLLAEARALGAVSVEVAPVALKEIFLEHVTTEA